MAEESARWRNGIPQAGVATRLVPRSCNRPRRLHEHEAGGAGHAEQTPLRQIWLTVMPLFVTVVVVQVDPVVLPELDVPEPVVPELEVPEPELPDPVLPDPVLPVEPARAPADIAPAKRVPAVAVMGMAESIVMTTLRKNVASMLPLADVKEAEKGVEP